jgi:PAS domain S-box-containing protein
MTESTGSYPDFLDPGNPAVAPIRAIFDSMSDLFFIVHDDGTIRRANARAQSVLGYDEDELCGRQIAEFHAPEQVGEVRRFFDDALDGADELCLVPLLSRSGERVAVETTATRIFWGQVKLLVWTCRDVSRRQRAEEALRKSEERYRATIDSLADMMHVVDERLRIILCNETYRSRLAEVGIGDEPIGANLLELQPFLPRSVGDEYRQVFDTGELLTTEEEVEVGGQRIWTETRKIPVRGEDERVHRVVTVIRDVTERRELADELRQVQKMETLGALAGGVAHDFNNLLMAIKVYAGFVQSPRPGGIEPEHALEEVIRAADSAQTLTGQLLAFSRRQLLRPSVLSLDRVVGELEELLGRLLGRDVELRTAHAADLWSVKADQSQIQQVLVNLAVNARDAIHETGGWLTIETSNAVLDGDSVRGHRDARPGEFVRIRVTDSGSGMEEAVRRRVFEPFFTTKEPGRGTGLGLSTAYGTIRQHGGFILVESEPGVGSAFDVYLPRSREESGDRAGAQEPRCEPRGSETVLVVEDEPVIKKLMIEILEGLGYDVIGADDGQAALDLPRDRLAEVDILVTDVVMPGIGGRELSERLSAVYPSLRVLFVTGYTDDEIVRRGFFEGSVPLLRKPFHADDLGREVRAVLDSEEGKVTIPPR